MILFTRRLMPAELRLQSDRETQKSEIYFTNHTLTGKPDAFPLLGLDICQAIPQAALSVTPSFARCSPTLFHQSHFDWEQELSVAGLTLPGDAADRMPNGFLAAPSPNLFHQSHFDWEQESLRF